MKRHFIFDMETKLSEVSYALFKLTAQVYELQDFTRKQKSLLKVKDPTVCEKCGDYIGECGGWACSCDCDSNLKRTEAAK